MADLSLYPYVLELLKKYFTVTCEICIFEKILN